MLFAAYSSAARQAKLKVVTAAAAWFCVLNANGRSGVHTATSYRAPAIPFRFNQAKCTTELLSSTCTAVARQQALKHFRLITTLSLKITAFIVTAAVPTW
jgi:hypothetical protein